MLAQLVTDEAKPESSEKWFVDFRVPFALMTPLMAISASDGHL